MIVAQKSALACLVLLCACRHAPMTASQATAMEKRVLTTQTVIVEMPAERLANLQVEWVAFVKPDAASKLINVENKPSSLPVNFAAANRLGVGRLRNKDLFDAMLRDLRADRGIKVISMPGQLRGLRTSAVISEGCFAATDSAQPAAACRLEGDLSEKTPPEQYLAQTNVTPEGTRGDDFLLRVAHFSARPGVRVDIAARISLKDECVVLLAKPFIEQGKRYVEIIFVSSRIMARS